MCGRYSLNRVEGFTDRFHVSNIIRIKPYNTIYPSDRMPVILQQDKNKVEQMKWGLIPSWSRDGKSLVINARAETLMQKPMFQPLIKSKRCLIPATGFYEWKKTEQRKIPYYFELKSKELFTFAGLYDEWMNEKQEIIKSYTIITTTPNSLVGEIHNRMPVILKRKDELEWINSETNNISEILSLLEPYSSHEMEAFPVNSFSSQQL